MGAQVVIIHGGSELLDTMASEQRLLRYKVLYEELVKQGIYRGLICQSWPTLVRVPVEFLEEALHTKDVRPALRSMAAGGQESVLCYHTASAGAIALWPCADKVHVRVSLTNPLPLQAASLTLTCSPTSTSWIQAVSVSSFLLVGAVLP